MLKRLVILIAMFAVPLLAIPQSSALADCDAQCQTVQGGINTANGGAPTNPATINSTVATVVNLLSVVVGVVAVIMIMVGGFRYVTSGGSPEATKSARNTITYALVGVVVVALAQTLVHFVWFHFKS